MNRHTDQLYRLAELPAFIEEALSNVSLKGVIAAYLDTSVPADRVSDAMEGAVTQYAEKWVDEWMSRNQPNHWVRTEDSVDHEILAIEAGVKLFSTPDCKAGLPE